MNILFLVNRGVSSRGGGGIERFALVVGKRMLADGNWVCYISVSQPVVPANDNGILQFYLPSKDDIDSRENIEYVHRFLLEYQIDILFNQQADSPVMLKLCHAAKVRTKAKLVSLLHFAPLHYLRLYKTSWADLFSSGLPATTILSYGLRNTVMFGLFQKRRLGNHYKQLYRWSDATVLLSENYKEQFYHLAKIRKDVSKLHAIPNPITNLLENIPHLQKRNEIIFVGRLKFVEKRLDLLLKIWKQVFYCFPDWELVILGTGEYEQVVKDKIAKEKLENIRLVGYAWSDKYFKTAKILCLTSNTEGFPLVIMEASNYYVVPMAFDSFSAVSDVIINKKTGFIVKAFDVEEYAQNLMGLMSNSSLLQSMAEKAHDHAQKFSMDKIVAEWYVLFHELM